jgi:hypothetical protein
MCIFTDEPEISARTHQVQELALGLDSQLKCIIDAKPTVSFVSWSKDGHVLPIGTAANNTRWHQQIAPDNVASLTIVDVQQIDAGLYGCQAYNAIGASSPYELHVIVSG